MRIRLRGQCDSLYPLLLGYNKHEIEIPDCVFEDDTTEQERNDTIYSIVCDYVRDQLPIKQLITWDIVEE